MQGTTLTLEVELPNPFECDFDLSTVEIEYSYSCHCDASKLLRGCQRRASGIKIRMTARRAEINTFNTVAADSGVLFLRHDDDEGLRTTSFRVVRCEQMSIPFQPVQICQKSSKDRLRDPAL